MESGSCYKQIHVTNGSSDLFLINSQDGYSGEEVFEDGLVGSGVIGAKHFFIEFS